MTTMEPTDHPVPTFRAAGLSREQIKQARRQADALAVQSRRELAKEWRDLAGQLRALSEDAGGNGG